MKLSLLVVIMLIGMLYASSMSCGSCGTECASSCGSRRFRACCFNYLRKKRGPDTHLMREEPDRFWETLEYPGTPLYILTPDWSMLESDSKFYEDNGMVENRMGTV